VPLDYLMIGSDGQLRYFVIINGNFQCYKSYKIKTVTSVAREILIMRYSWQATATEPFK